MLKIKDQLDAGKYTVLFLDGDLPPHRKGVVIIGDKKYKTEIVYDLPRSIGVIGNGYFIEKEIE